MTACFFIPGSSSHKIARKTCRCKRSGQYIMWQYLLAVVELLLLLLLLIFSDFAVWRRLVVGIGIAA